MISAGGNGGGTGTDDPDRPLFRQKNPTGGMRRARRRGIAPHICCAADFLCYCAPGRAPGGADE
jgi:hypothetical protein